MPQTRNDAGIKRRKLLMRPLKHKIWIRRVRLWSGLAIFLFLLTHFSNHALGMISLDAMERARFWLMWPWRTTLGESILLTALLSHLLLGLWAIYIKRTLRMPMWEAMQILFGLLVAPLLVFHVSGTMQMRQMIHPDAYYTWVVLYFTAIDPWAGLRQLVLLSAAWIHGCIGLHFWLRIRAGYQRHFPIALSMMVLIPVLAVLGVTQAGREVNRLASDPSFVSSLQLESNRTGNDDGGYGYPTNPVNENASAVAESAPNRNAILAGLAALLAIVLIARAMREWRAARADAITVRYFNGPQVRIPKGWSLLEASRSHGIPHTSVCGGRARCSTCRVRIAGDPTFQPSPAPIEQRLLERINAAPNVRLACQLRPTQDVTVTPLLSVHPRTGLPAPTGSAHGGEERDVVVLFADLRGFTRMAELKLPYDVVFLLNRYFEAVGGAIDACGGIANQFTGDGVMALFGVGSEPMTGSRQALRAAGEMTTRVEALSAELGDELPSPLQIGIGIHTGPAVVGEMGYEGTRYLTAVGDTTNTASRLESMTKEFKCQLVASAETLRRAGIADSGYPHQGVMLRNREQPLDVVVIADAKELAAKVPRT